MRFFLLLLVIVVILAACSHNLKEEFDGSFNKYNDAVAMNNMPGSGLFVADKNRETYQASVAAAKNTRIFEYRIVSKKVDEPARKARVEVEFDYYMLNSNRVKTLRYAQEWVFVEEKDFKGWRILTPLPAFK